MKKYKTMKINVLKIGLGYSHLLNVFFRQWQSHFSCKDRKQSDLQVMKSRLFRHFFQHINQA